jgi:predicted permease
MTTVFLSLAAIVLVGNQLQRLFPAWNVEDFRKSINQLVLNVLLPALIFKVIATSDLGGELVAIPLAMAAGIGACLAVALGLFAWLPIARPTKGALVLACAFGNVTYLGLPVLQGVFPDTPLVVAKVAVLCEVTVTPLNFVVGSLLAMRFGEQGSGLGQSLRQLLRLPPLWAMAAALVCNLLRVPVPEFALHAAGVLGNAVSGLMVLSLGMALRRQQFTHLGPLLAAGGFKLLLCPFVVFAVAGAFALPAHYLEAVTLEGAMPTQLLTLAIADRYRLDDKLLAQAILLSTVAAFVTIPLVRALLF